MAKYVKNIASHLDDLRNNLEKGELEARRLRGQTTFKLVALIVVDLILLNISLTGTDTTIWVMALILSIGFTSSSIYTLGKVTSHISFCGTLLDDMDRLMVEEYED